MVPRVALRSSAALLALFALFGFNPQALAASTDTWVGSAGSTNLATATNWTYTSGSGPVGTGDSLVFTSANASTSGTLTDTLANPIAISITFNSGAISYTLTGNTLEDYAGWSDQSTNVETIDNPVTWYASHSVTVATGGDLVFGSAIGGTGNFSTNTSSGGVITFQGKTGSKQSIFCNDNIIYYHFNGGAGFPRINNNCRKRD